MVEIFLIFPDHPHEYDPKYMDTDPRPLPTFSEHCALWKKALSDYKASHEGWLLPKRQAKEADNKEPEKDSVSDVLEEHRGEIRSNITKNVKFLRAEGNEALETIQKETGIRTVEDLRHWVSEQLKLANECLQEFMSGYRQGRDEEVDKMVNEYFLEMPSVDDDEEDKEILTKLRGRKPKRRVRTL
eukprot:CAMPEP_0194223002 /NCGR_PEP_ID=MMETSP0156-20130528/34111_1 /TAXON_ID=33649 /ORGANISM="Thalassionema nitzschioides, Strain L26-B" /LENGTH=185 /DNA_ID=CAMNT_0038953997 /DNA_START=206 /DNA_END=764 /DNA_ORIENTATION=+